MNAAAFWNDFAARADSWAKQMRLGHERKVFDEIDGLLQTYDITYCFDITTNNDGCLLMFSPEGDSHVAKSIDGFLEDAPRCALWMFLGRRSKKDLADAAAIVRNLYLLDPTKMRFQVRDGHRGPSVHMIVPSSADLLPDEAQGMINTFLWHAIGEDKVMAEHIEAHVTFDDEPDEATISASEMVAVVGRGGR